MEKKEKPDRLEDLDVNGVVQMLESLGMQEFIDLVTERDLDGRKLTSITEGLIKLWRPKTDAKKFVKFVEELKNQPEKINYSKMNEHKVEISKMESIEAQYQTVTVRKKEHVTTTATVEELLKKIVPAKSFLYRNQPKATDKPASSYYVPMDAGTPKKPKKFFRLSSYEYPLFDMKNFRLSKNENFNDRGYYSVKTNTTYQVQKTYKKQDKTRYKTLSSADELKETFPEEHFYEDLNYMDSEQKDLKELKTQSGNVKPIQVKIQEMFQSFKLPFFKRNEELEETTRVEDKEETRKEDCKCDKEENDTRGHIYENSDSLGDLYDTPKKREPVDDTVAVEEYLEPVRVSKEYSDVTVRRDESLFGYIMGLFEQRLRLRRETSDVNHSEDSDSEYDHPTADIKNPLSNINADITTDIKNNEVKTESKQKRKTNMVDRPLPVPVENEPYYMDIERSEAENLLKGQPDGTFVLRPSSQPNHAYTLTVSCANAVHNVGVRRRPDGRLALGYARRGERSFADAASLLRFHRRRRLLLVVAGNVCGATTLNDSPQYYQTPKNVPM